MFCWPNQQIVMDYSYGNMGEAPYSPGGSLGGKAGCLYCMRKWDASCPLWSFCRVLFHPGFGRGTRPHRRGCIPLSPSLPTASRGLVSILLGLKQDRSKNEMRNKCFSCGRTDQTQFKHEVKEESMCSLLLFSH